MTVNDMLATDDPTGLQAIFDPLGPGTIQVFFERWAARLPLPLTAADRDGGYWWELSMRQIEVSRTIVFTQPRYARVTLNPFYKHSRIKQYLKQPIRRPPGSKPWPAP